MVLAVWWYSRFTRWTSENPLHAKFAKRAAPGKWSAAVEILSKAAQPVRKGPRL